MDVVKRKDGRFWVEDHMIDAYLRHIGPDAYAIYCILARHANRESEADFVTKKLMNKACLCRATVKKALKTLSEYGLLMWEDKFNSYGTPDGFTFTLLEIPEVPTKGVGQEFTENRVSRLEPGADSGQRDVSRNNTSDVSRNDTSPVTPQHVTCQDMTHHLSARDTSLPTTMESSSLELFSMEEVPPSVPKKETVDATVELFRVLNDSAKSSQAQAALTPTRKKLNKQRETFIVPTLEEVIEYGLTLPYPRENLKWNDAQITEECEAFYDYEQSCGWLVGQKEMVSWRAALVTRFRNARKFGARAGSGGAGGGSIAARNAAAGVNVGTYQDQVEAAAERARQRAVARGETFE